MTSVLRKSGATHTRPSILWFTLLCSLLGALWSLNLFPQGPMTFRIQTTVVLNSSRLEVLEQMLEATNPSFHHPDCLALRKVTTKGLNSTHSNHPVTTRTGSELPELHCITFESEWNRRVKPEEIKSWLSTLTEPSAKIFNNSETARDLRWANYKLDLAKLYKTTDAGRAIEEEEKNLSAQTVGFTKVTEADDAVSKIALNQPQQTTGIDINALEKNAAVLKQQWQSERFDIMGTISLSSLSKWNPKVCNDPLIAPMMGLVIGALAGVSLAFVLRRKSAHDKSSLSAYASTLEELQIPFFQVGLQAEERAQPSHEHSQRSHLQWWISGCEWSLLFWGISATARFAIDSNWRELSISQPLLALARLFSSV